MKRQNQISEIELKRWRELSATKVLVALADHAKKDSTFIPIKYQSTSRWHATVNGEDYELLCTGSKFWDTRSEKGGGGAIDLVMYLFDLEFRNAVTVLQQEGL